MIEDPWLVDDHFWLADKYKAKGVHAKLAKILVSPSCLQKNSIGAFAVACHNNLEEEAKLAVHNTFSIDVISHTSVCNLRAMAATAYYRLLVEHAHRRGQLINVITKVQRSREQSTACHCGEALVKEIRLELSSRPFLDRGVLERSLSSARKSGSSCKGFVSDCVLAPGLGSWFLSDIIRTIQHI